MYSEQNVRDILASYSDTEMELSLCKAHYYKREEDMSEEHRQHILYLERKIMMINGMLLVLSVNEEFVVRRHIIDQLDWPQILNEYIDLWGKESEKTIRSLQICQTKALKKIADALNRQSTFSKIDSML